MSSDGGAVLTLYGREYCSLCQKMADALAVQGLSASAVDIDSDPAFEVLYGELVPALVGKEGYLICYHHLNQAALDAYLADFR